MSGTHVLSIKIICRPRKSRETIPLNKQEHINFIHTVPCPMSITPALLLYQKAWNKRGQAPASCLQSLYSRGRSMTSLKKKSRAIRSWSLFCKEQLEQFAHSSNLLKKRAMRDNRSQSFFNMSNFERKSKEQRSEERKSKFPTLVHASHGVVL